MNASVSVNSANKELENKISFVAFAVSEEEQNFRKNGENNERICS